MNNIEEKMWHIIGKDEPPILPAQQCANIVKERAIAFGAWLGATYVRQAKQDEWVNCDEFIKKDDPPIYTTAELYETFLNTSNG